MTTSEKIKKLKKISKRLAAVGWKLESAENERDELMKEQDKLYKSISKADKELHGEKLAKLGYENLN